MLAQTVIESSNSIALLVLDVDDICMEFYRPRTPDLDRCTKLIKEAKTTIVRKCTRGRASCGSGLRAFFGSRRAVRSEQDGRTSGTACSIQTSKWSRTQSLGIKSLFSKVVRLPK